MIDEPLLKEIEQLAGGLRAKTFRAAAEWIMANECKYLAETGCYRGIPQDGQSTIILAKLARHIGAKFSSFELNPNHIEQAVTHLAKFGLARDKDVWLVPGDSVETVRCLDHIDFVYLDSYDYEEGNWLPSQLHQLAEVGAVYCLLRRPCAILMDDCFPPHGGKTALSKLFLLGRGWKLVAEGYQLLFVKET